MIACILVVVFIKFIDYLAYHQLYILLYYKYYINYVQLIVWLIRKFSHFRSRSNIQVEKDPETPQVELATEETKDESQVPLPWQLPTDPDLLEYISEIQERIAPLASTEEQITELARCSFCTSDILALSVNFLTLPNYGRCITVWR